MNLLKNKKTVALILTVMMLFSSAATVLAAPEKVQVGLVDGKVLQYGYSTVKDGGSNRTSFVNAIINSVQPRTILLWDAEVDVWYDVNGVTLVDAKADPARTDVDSETDYVPVLDNGNEVSQAVSQLIDDLNKLSELSTLPEVQLLYDRYNALSPADKTAIDANASDAVDYMLQLYADLTGEEPGPGPDDEAGTLTGITGVDGIKVTVTINGFTGPGTTPSKDDFEVTDSNNNTYEVLGVNNGVTASEYILTLDDAVAGLGTLSVTYNDVTKTIPFTPIADGFVLASNTLTITADGKSRATLTMTALKNGATDTTFIGTVNFTSSRQSSFSKANPIAFDRGVVTVDLVSTYSPVVTIVDTIRATLVDTPENQTLQGHYEEITIRHVPSGAELDDRIFISQIGSDSASEVYVTFNTAYDPEKLAEHLDEISVSQDHQYGRYKDDPDDDNAAHDLPNLWRSPVGFEPVQGSDTMVKLNFTQDQVIRDNTDIYVRVISDSIDPYLTTQIGAEMKSFTLNDRWAAEMVKVDMRGQTLEVLFTAPVVTRDYIDDEKNITDDYTITDFNKDYLERDRVGVGIPENWVINGHRLTDEDIQVSSTKVTSQKGIDIGVLDSSNNLLVYRPGTLTTNTVDNRDRVTIQLTAKAVRDYLKPVGGTNTIQVSNVRDFAGLVDPYNISNTQELTFPTPSAGSTPVPQSEAPYVVWVSAHDNIYGLRDGKYQLSDIVYVQFSKNMSGDVELSDKYTINTNPVPLGTSIIDQHDVAYSSPDDAKKPNKGVGSGTLVTITMPYDFLGEKQNIFITESESPYTTVPYYTTANYPDGDRDPYQPVPHHTVYVNSDVRDAEATPKTLAQSGQTNPRFTTVYHKPAILWQAPVVAYVNADTAIEDPLHYNQYRNDIATLAQAQKSNYVKAIVRTPVYYDDDTGKPYPSTAALPAPNSVFNDPNYTGDVVFPPVYNQKGASIPYGNITITAPKAKSVLIPADIEVNGTVNIVATVAEVVEVYGTIAGDVTITAPEAGSVELGGTVGTNKVPAGIDVTANKAKSVEINTFITGSADITANSAAITVNQVVEGNLTIDSTNGASVTLNNEVGGNVIIDARRADIEVNKALGGDVTISTIHGANVALNDTVSGDVDITADKANIEINKTVAGDVDITSAIGDEIWVRTVIAAGKALTVNAPFATLHLLPDQTVTAGSTYADLVVIEEIGGDTIIVDEKVTVGTFEIASSLTKAFTIKYSGTISTLNIQGGGGNITVLIKSNGNATQEAAVQTKWNALLSGATGNTGRLQLATATSL